MKTSLKFLLTGLSAIGLGFGAALPSTAQSQITPNAETTPANTPQTPPPTNRDTGIPPVRNQPGQSENQTTPAAPNNGSSETQTTPNNSGTPNSPALPNNQSVPGSVAPANRPEQNNTPTNAPSGTTPTSTPSTSFSGSDSQSIDQIVRTSPSFELFNALLRVADSNGGFSQLAGSSDFTVFAPTDEALAALPPATFKALVQPENRSLLIQVLENHVVKGKVSSSDLAAKQVRSLGGNEIAAQGGTGALSIGNAQVVGADIQAENGVIHAVNQAIIPADVQSKLTSLAPQATTTQP